jgi:hypothetical protein
VRASKLSPKHQPRIPPRCDDPQDRRDQANINASQVARLEGALRSGANGFCQRWENTINAPS